MKLMKMNKIDKSIYLLLTFQFRTNSIIIITL